MKIILFGGAELSLGQFLPQLKLIGKTIKKLKPRQILHIPFARTVAKEIEWSGDWFNKHIHLKGVKYLNAANKADIIKTQNPLIFISGGGENFNLIKKIKSNRKLLKLIANARCIIGESAGAMVLGEYMRTKGGVGESKLIKGLGIIADTIIEPHYTERNRQGLLIREMKQTNVHYGLGVDCMTGIEFELREFPEKYRKIGKGSVEIKYARPPKN